MTVRVAAAALLALAFATTRAAGQEVAEGRLHLIWDARPSPEDPDGLRYFVVQPDGSDVELARPADPELRRALESLDGELVVVTSNGSEAGVIRPAAVVAEPGPAAAPHRAPADGTYPFITLLCRFSDSPAASFGVTETARMQSTEYPGMGDYYAEMARRGDVMSANAVSGWYVLPNPRSSYVQEFDADLGAIARDCTAAADPFVDFSAFYGINLQLGGENHKRASEPHDIVSQGGSWTLDLDGESRRWGVTWITLSHHASYLIIAHEMGHAIGWPHSSGRYGEEYDSRWDVMSSGYVHLVNDFGWVPIHTIGPHKESAGWIPPERTWIPAPGTSQAFVIGRSAVPPDDSELLLAHIPVDGSTHYTVESRLLAGYDTPLPAEAVLIHEVDFGRAYVVDPDENGNPNDDGAAWTAGESFVDASAGVEVDVLGAEGSGFLVRIDMQDASPVVVASDAERPAAGIGVPYTDQLEASAEGEVSWWAAEGSLPEGLTLDASGRVSGTPSGFPGTERFIALASAGEHSGWRTFSVDLYGITSGPGLTKSYLGYEQSIRLQVGPSGTGSNWRVSGGEAPPGLSLSSDGVLSGILEEVGTFTFEVAADVAGLSVARELSMSVVEPALAPAVVLNGVVAPELLSADQARYLDLQGNQNGRVDIGDARAWLVAHGIVLATAGAGR